LRQTYRLGPPQFSSGSSLFAKRSQKQRDLDAHRRCIWHLVQKLAIPVKSAAFVTPFQQKSGDPYSCFSAVIRVGVLCNHFQQFKGLIAFTVCR